MTVSIFVLTLEMQIKGWDRLKITLFVLLCWSCCHMGGFFFQANSFLVSVCYANVMQWVVFTHQSALPKVSLFPNITGKKKT